MNVNFLFFLLLYFLMLYHHLAVVAQQHVFFHYFHHSPGLPFSPFSFSFSLQSESPCDSLSRQEIPTVIQGRRPRRSLGKKKHKGYDHECANQRNYWERGGKGGVGGVERKCKKGL